MDKRLVTEHHTAVGGVVPKETEVLDLNDLLKHVRLHLVPSLER